MESYPCGRVEHLKPIVLFDICFVDKLKTDQKGGSDVECPILSRKATFFIKS